MILRMIEDHKSSVESACETARDILSRTDDSREKRLVSADIDSLMTHWTSINTTAVNQLTAVEAGLAAANDYQGKADPFYDWLESMEKKVAGLELASADTEAIQQQIALQRVSFFVVVVVLVLVVFVVVVVVSTVVVVVFVALEYALADTEAIQQQIALQRVSLL